MHILSFPGSIRKIITLLFVLGSASFVFAQEASQNLNANRGYLQYRRVPERKRGTVIFRSASAYSRENIEKEGLSDSEKKARAYRNQGLELQKIGSIDAAMNLYKKAIELDLNYAVAYNDLGVIYEAKGYPDLAEQVYLIAIDIDPYYLSVYSNLALLYENENQLDKAAFYWQKRLELGWEGDPWVAKAREHLEDIRLAEQDNAAMSGEHRIIGLTEGTPEQKDNLQ